MFAFGIKLDTDNGTWAAVNGSAPFILSDVTGDNIFLYCLNADSLPHFIVGAIYNDVGWKAYDANSTEEIQLEYSESVLPERLSEDGNIALKFFPNYLYKGPDSGNRADLVVTFANASNWEGSNQAFVVDTGSSAYRSILVSIWIGMSLSTMIAMISFM